MERIYHLEEEVESLKTKLRAKEKELDELKQKQMLLLSEQIVPSSFEVPSDINLNNTTNIGVLPKWAIERYSRQILLPNIGVEGQERLCVSRILVVGAGGLGCPAAAYLAGAGVGEVGIVDGDDVDVSNIHRQILHGEGDRGTNKAVSAASSLRKINSRIRVTAHTEPLSTTNAMGLLQQYDAVLDCTDNVATRYLLGDVCALLKKPLVSGSALKMEGQLSVYSYSAEKNANEQDRTYVGPCYRCVFPTPPPPAAVGSCAAHGVAGPVPALIGCLQALETIKLVTGATHDKLLVGRMLLFDGEDMTFRTVKLRPRNPQCRACSGDPSLEELLDYETFCSARREEDPDLDLLSPSNRMTAQELASYLKTQGSAPGVRSPLLVDVRSREEFSLCGLAGARCCPLDELGGKVGVLQTALREGGTVTFICRRGNDSQLAVLKLLETLEEPYRDKVKDVIGGLHAWAKHVDPSFPVY